MNKPGTFRILTGWYTPELFASLPNAFFVFGDNLLREGRGGQAAVCRDHPQAIGVATCSAPGIPFTDTMESMDHVSNDMCKITNALDEGHDVYWPAAGIGTGTGIANLAENAPLMLKTIEVMRDWMLKEYGERQ